MMSDAHQKVTARHVQRQAMLYVRQSTLHQVLENTESTARQYALRERAIALGWPIERIITIDQDLGQSGASAVDREGFQRLVAEVGLGHVGLVLGLEVSRLARSSLDWHHLLEICAMTGTLILDEDGLYDPVTFNDRLLLGMKGTMSEAELHILRARLRGGILNKAGRAALKLPLPMGLAYAEDETVILDPDAQIQQAFRVLFATFKRIGSAWGTVKYFREQGLLFPRRVRMGPHVGEVHWAPLLHSTMRHPSCAIRVMLGHSVSDEHVLASSWMAKSGRRPYPRKNGRFSSKRPMLATFPGKSTKRISSSCSTTVRRTGKIVDTVLHGKDRLCFKGWSSVGDVATA